jgi:hypothetical protein
MVSMNTAVPQKSLLSGLADAALLAALSATIGL